MEENFACPHSTLSSTFIMTPKKQPSGRSEDTPQWTTATAARLDRIADDLHRQIELVDADTGTQNVHQIAQLAGAGARSTHAQMHGGASNP